MAFTLKNVGDLEVVGNLTVSGLIVGNISRNSLILEGGSVYPLLPNYWRIWDDYKTSIGTASGDDLGLFSGTYGTQIPYVRTPDLNASGGPNNYRARFLFRLPPEYEIGQNCFIRVLAGMITSVAATSATIDFEAWQQTTDLGVGTDVVATSATSINFLTFSTYDFLLNGATLGSGNSLDIRTTITTQSATASSHFAAFSRCEVLVPTRG